MGYIHDTMSQTFCETIMLLISLFFSCTDSAKDSAEPTFTFPDVSSMPALRGPGAPQVTFAEEELFENCAPLYGGEDDFLHHNLVLGYRGHMLMPWVPEWGQGGMSWFDMSDPCNQKRLEKVPRECREPRH